MTIDDIAGFCEIKNCRVSFGSPEIGTVRVDGSGVLGRHNNYRRFIALNEMASLPNPGLVLSKSAEFTIESQTGTEKVTREEFQSRLARFLELVG